MTRPRLRVMLNKLDWGVYRGHSQQPGGLAPLNKWLNITPLKIDIKKLALSLLLLILLQMATPLSAIAANNSKDRLQTYSYKQFASLLVNDYKQMKCLDKLWTKESNWRPTAKNPKSSAYGIPQLLKMTETNPYRQIVLGIKYLDHRYKSNICLALNTHKIKGHY